MTRKDIIMADYVNNWHKIWGKKSLNGTLEGKSEFEAFCMLKKADGFDVAVENEEKYYQGFYNEFQRFFDAYGDSVKSVYEVGCGSGVNLFLFKNRIKDVKLGGIDYSESLLNQAAKIGGGDDFICGEASDMPTEPKYDLVWSEGVFEYFSSTEYAATVLRKMITKSNKAVILLGVYDKDKEQELMDHKRAIIPDYDKKYEGLPKRFYSKSWVEEIAGEFGKKVIFSLPDNPEYWNAGYQFNVVIM